ncbi:MAG: polysaccharide deacetylase family protein [Acidimicrobiales bacterium]
MSDHDGDPGHRSRLRAACTTLAGAAAVAEFLPAVVALGQWSPVQALPGGVCRWQGPRYPARVALTFDDGPHPEGTPKMLDRLDELGLRATFFVLGSEAAREPELVGEIVRRGHTVGTHGYAHAHHLLRPPRWVGRDLDAAEEVMDRLGVTMRWFRPTFGQASGATLVHARRKGWDTVLWSSWGREWATSSPEGVAARIRRRLRPGAVVLLHDSDRFGPPGMWRTAWDALPAVAEDLGRRRLHAVTLDELVS